MIGEDDVGMRIRTQISTDVTIDDNADLFKFIFIKLPMANAAAMRVAALVCM